MMLEKLIFIASIFGFVFLNQYVWSSIDLMLYQWLATIGLALTLLILNEFVGRIIQSIRLRK
ncbi:MAG TPA: hypothetical protein D7H87_06650 [Candidatus Poseidoniales archaeon]|nr:MAG TPA: hypothetical protein D7H87_06650 [Candidatus Poseidoniales archaeon]HII32966.1 hypothetical protein [Candidatus Poseidoniaceae archaeon]|tara:strand:+ start:5831 stop:6016 length:186 start_codon:yes stop_codon:yes gene_type:complete